MNKILICFFLLTSALADTASQTKIKPLVDLHTHSTYSDGTDGPIEIVRLAKAANVGVLALTDHDQLRYSKAAWEEAEKLGIMLIPGTEISVEWTYSKPTSHGTFSKAHLLGYFTRDYPGTELFALLKSVRERRANRNLIILEKISELFGITLDMQEVEDQARDSKGELQVVGRPHIAAVLVKKKYAKDISDAFAKFLNDNVLNLEKWGLDLVDAIRAVDRHGGISVLAHPVTLNITYQELDEQLHHLLRVQKAPLRGIECFSSRHSTEQALMFQSLAYKYNLLVTGGSDYHGANKKNVPIGVFGEGSVSWHAIGIPTFSRLLDLYDAISAKMGLPQLSEGPSFAPEEEQRSIQEILFHMVAFGCLWIFCFFLVPLSTASPQVGWKGKVQTALNNSCISSFLQMMTSGGTPVSSSSSNGNGLASPTLSHTSTGIGSEGSEVDPESQQKRPKETPFDLINFCFCAAGLCVFFLGWSWLQERIMTVDYDGERFDNSEFIIFVNRLSALCFAAIALKFFVESTHHEAPFYQYATTSLSNMVGTWCQYEALKYISFPMQVLSKTTKVIASMAMGTILHRKIYARKDYITAVVAFLGLMTFHLSEDPRDEEGYATSGFDSFVGFCLLITYVLADSFTGQWQQGVFKTYQISPYQMMFWMNSFSCLLSFLFLILEGRFLEGCWFALNHLEFSAHLVVMALCAAIGQAFIYYTVATHGAVALSAIMTFRQFMTIVISIITFGHAINLGGMFGLFVVFSVSALWIYEEYNWRFNK